MPSSAARAHGRKADTLDVSTGQQQYAQIFSALGEPIRLEIIRYIASADELPCTLLDERLPISKSTISYHIKVLHRAQLISVRRDGRYYYYRLRRDVFDRLLPAFLDRLPTDGGELPDMLLEPSAR